MHEIERIWSVLDYCVNVLRDEPVLRVSSLPILHSHLWLIFSPSIFSFSLSLLRTESNPLFYLCSRLL